MSSSIAMWVLYSLLVGTVIVGAALAAEDVQRARKRSTRWIWCGAIPLIIGLSIVAPLRRVAEPASPALHSVTSAQTQPGNAEAGRHQFGQWMATLRHSLAWPMRAVLGVARAAVAGIPASIPRAFVVLWILASLATLGYFAAGYLRVRRLVTKWPVHRVAAESVRLSPATGPAVVGLMPAEIVVPEWLRDRPLAEQCMVIAHEREHVSAGDPWLLVIACAAVVVIPWHPALWFALGRLQLATELDCDNRVLSSGVPVGRYGSLLIELSSIRCSLPTAVPSFICHSSHLERRLVAMTSRASRFATSRSIAGGLLALSALLVACSSDLPTASELSRMDGKTAVQAAKRVALIDSTHVRYVVDGKSVSAAEASAVDAAQISDVEITRGTGGTPSEVRINKKAALGTDVIPPPKPGVESLAEAKAASRMPFTGKFEGLFVVDGKIVDNTAGLKALRPEQIASVEVLKGVAATQAYSDVRAEKGVIKVTTRQNP
jgi:beta-lactamase regulating signal transducer with metallopeptidase domain